MKLVNCTKCNIRLELIEGNIMEAIDRSSFLCKPCYKLFNEYLYNCYLKFIQPERLSEKTSKDDAIV